EASRIEPQLDDAFARRRRHPAQPRPQRAIDALDRLARRDAPRGIVEQAAGADVERGDRPRAWGTGERGPPRLGRRGLARRRATELEILERVATELDHERGAGALEDRDPRAGRGLGQRAADRPPELAERRVVAGGGAR